jgi:sugar phosphate isomerase/epimerase
LGKQKRTEKNNMFKNGFMHKWIYVLALLFSALITQAQKGSPLFPQAPGMVSYTYRSSLQRAMAATLDTIKSLGVKDMEFSNLFGKTAADVKRLLDERGMFCSSFGVSYDDAVNKTSEVAQNALTLGAKFVRVAWIPHDAPFSLNHAQKAVADFNKVGKILKEKHGLTFTYHNHGYEFHPYQGGTLFDFIMKETNPEYVSFEMDILWVAFPGQDPVALLNKYGNRFKLMHLKDLRTGVAGNLSGKTPVENDVALGAGRIDIPAVLKAAKKYVQHYYIEDESPSYATQVPRSMQYLKSLKQ